MRWFCSRFIIIFCGVLLLCAVLVGRARTEPAPKIIDGLGVCQGMPCYMGVIPGRTTLKEARVMMPNLSVLEDHGRADGSYQGTHVTLNFGDAHRISHIKITFAHPPTIATLLMLYGPPCKIRVYQYGLGLSVEYPALYATLDEKPPAPQSEITQIILSESYLSRCAINKAEGEVPWLGLASVRRYLSAAAIVVP
jgi:hypothetical protein